MSRQEGYTFGMQPVFEYLDYREFLKDFYDARKSEVPLFSYRVMADGVGMDASNLFRVLQRTVHLPARCVPLVLDYVGLTGRAAEYFQVLVAYARTRGKVEKQNVLDRALALRDVQRKMLEGAELALFVDWWTVAVRCLLEVSEGRAVPEELGSRLRPPVPGADIERAIDTLLELGMVKRVASGKLALTDSHLSAGGSTAPEAVRDFQRKIMDLAKESLARFPRESRDVSTLSIAVDQEAFEDIRVLLKECRRQIQKRVEDARRPDRVMQLAMAFFPLAPAERGA